AAAKLPLNPAPPLKDRSRFHLIGKPVARLDTPAKCNGSAVFGIDVVVPGMLNAAIRTARSYSGQVTAIRNEADILKMSGVHAVVKVAALAIANEDAGAQQPRGPHLPRYNAVSVIADHFWQAKRALDVLDVEFDGGGAGDLSSAGIDAMLEAGLDAERAVTALSGVRRTTSWRRATVRSSSGASCCRTSRTRRSSRSTPPRATATVRSKS